MGAGGGAGGGGDPASWRWRDRVKLDGAYTFVTNEEYVTFESSNGVNLNGEGEYPMPPLGVLAGVSLEF